MADLEQLYRAAIWLLKHGHPLPADTAGAATVAGAVMLDDPEQVQAMRREAA